MAFIRHENEKKIVENFKGGEGHLEMQPILETNEEMYNKGRVFSKMTLQKGCQVGRHFHEGDSETLYILSGKGKYLLNGEMVDVGPGDTCFCGDGEEHFLVNESDEPLVFIALVLFK